MPSALRSLQCQRSIPKAKPSGTGPNHSRMKGEDGLRMARPSSRPLVISQSCSEHWRMLVLEVNSQQRAERGRALVEPVLGQLIDQPLTEARTVAQLMVSRPANKSMALSSGLSADEERAVLHATLDRHYMNLLDEPVPMLGNAPPLVAAKTAIERLVARLKP